MTLAIAIIMACTCIWIIAFEAGRDAGRAEQHRADQTAAELALVEQAMSRHPSRRAAA